MVAKLLDLNKLWSCQYGKRKNDMYDFLMHYCTQGQKRCRGRKTPHFSLPHFLLRLGYRHESKIAVPMQLKWLHSLFSYSSRHRRVFRLVSLVCLLGELWRRDTRENTKMLLPQGHQRWCGLFYPGALFGDQRMQCIDVSRYVERYCNRGPNPCLHSYWRRQESNYALIWSPL